MSVSNLERMNTNPWHSHHDEYMSEKPLDRQCADCYATWTPSSDGFSAHMVHEEGCLWVAFLWDQDQGREYIEWLHDCLEPDNCPDETTGMPCNHLWDALKDYDRWADALRLRTEYLGEWCPKHERTVLVVDGGSNSGFAGEGVSWTDLACGHQNMEVGR